MNRNYEDWLKYYENATKEQVIEDMMLDINSIKEKDKEIERLKEQNNDLRRIYKNTYNRLFQNGNNELARYFQAQIDDCPTFYVEPIIDFAKEWKDYKSRNEKAIENIDLVIELIKQQPTEDDSWILNKLNGFKYLLNGSDNDSK